MKFATGLLAAGLFLADVEASHAVVRISRDRGGAGSYVARWLYRACIRAMDYVPESFALAGSTRF
jgi:hypothetical protein